MQSKDFEFARKSIAPYSQMIDNEKGSSFIATTAVAEQSTKSK